MPIEKVLAPSVVIPPCARSNAWKTNTIVAKTHVTAGPKSTALKPLPVGCEELPVTDGSFREDKTKINAPETANNGFDSGFSSVILFYLYYSIGNYWCRQ